MPPPADPRPADFDRIGVGYSGIRRPDPRLAAAIADALGHGSLILNVGAGAGSYEPGDRQVVSAEPSSTMLSQHAGRRRVQAVAGELPFATACFDAAMATLTVHHWPDLGQGLAEMRRVSARQVVFTWDPDHDEQFWLHSEYLPELATFERSRFPSLATIVDLLGARQVVPFPTPTTSPTVSSTPSGAAPGLSRSTGARLELDVRRAARRVRRASTRAAAVRPGHGPLAGDAP